VSYGLIDQPVPSCVYRFVNEPDQKVSLVEAQTPITASQIEKYDKIAHELDQIVRDALDKGLIQIPPKPNTTVPNSEIPSQNKRPQL